MKKKTISKDSVLVCFFAVIIFLINIRHIAILDGPFIFPDELGYLGNAAVLVGKDWNEVMRYSVWYAYGWSIILVPLFLVFSSMQIIYRCINVLNAILVVIVFLMQRHLWQRIFKNITPCLITSVAACACFFPGILVGSSTAWSEIWLLFIFNVLTVFLYYMIQKPRTYKAAVFGALLYYFYVCHNRMITVVITGILVFLVLIFTGVIKKRDSLLFFGTLVLSGILFGTMKAWIVTARGGLPSGNDIGTVLTNLSGLATADGLKIFAGVLLGQFLYFCVASCGIAPVGMYASTRKIILAIKQHDIKDAILEIWLVLAFLGTLATSAFFLGTNTEIFPQYVFYGRYFDQLVVMLLSYGFLYLASLKKNTDNFSAYKTGYVCVVGICSFVSSMAFHQINGNGYLDKLSDTGVAFFLDRFADDPAYVMALFSIIATMLIMELFRHKNVLKYTAIVGFFSFCLINTHLAEWAITWTHENHLTDIPLVNAALEYDFEDLPVYLLCDDLIDTAYFRCMLPDVPLKFTAGLSLLTIPDEKYYTIISRENYFAQVSEVHSEPIVHNWNHLLLFVDKTIKNTNEPLSILLDMMHLNNISSFEIDHIHVEPTDDALAFFGPYIGLKEGNYRLNVTLDVENAEELQSYGSLQIFSASRLRYFGGTEITKEFVNTGIGTISVPFSLEEDINDIQIYLQASSGTTYDVYSLTFENLYDLSDEGTVAEVIDSRTFSDSCGVDSSNQVPNGDTLGRFRNLLI